MSRLPLDLHPSRIVRCHLGDVILVLYVNVVLCSEGKHLHAMMLIMVPSILFLLLFHPFG